MKITFLLLAALALVPVAHAQMRDNRDQSLSCSEWGGGRQAHHCDIREQTIATAGHLNVDAGINGGVTVKGWLRNDVLVRSRIDAWADSDAAARALAGQVTVNAASGQVSARGPNPNSNIREGWSVSYEIFVPQTSDLKLTAHNGAVSISDVRGRLEFGTQNGAVHLARIAGDVNGATVNGALRVELAGAAWEGRQLDARTTNGAVTVSVPQAYSAHLQTETVNGAVKSEFPVTVSGRIRRQNLDMNLGSGGALIHVGTVNGAVHLQRI
ncbi:MAG TPA: DUF4097 family beta strand repeat-containing protein [Bryobacteraceae bacterium]|jgi:hypothetical protein